MLAHVENRITYSGNGNATEFAYQFKILNRTDIKVLLTDADGKEKLLTKDYYVDVEKSVVRYPGYAVGAEVPESERPAVLPAGWKLTIYREVPVTQETDLPDQYPFNQVEAIGDKLTMIAQQLTDTTGRSLKIGVSMSTDIDTTIPWENGKSFRISNDGKTLELSEDPAKVLPLAQGVYAQTQAQAQSAAASARLAEDYKNAAETAKNAASLYATNAKNSAGEAKTYMDNAKRYSENVNVFTPSVSSDGVLSWTNKAGLPNPASVNIKGAKGDQGLQGATGTAATIKIGRVTTGAAGSNASVTNSGTASNVVLDFILPRGKDGADGGIVVDTELSDTSTNPVQNKVVKMNMDTLYNGVMTKLGVFSSKIPTKVSTLENDAGYLTQHQSLDDYAKKNTANTWSAQQSFKQVLLGAERYLSPVVSGSSNTPQMPVMHYIATGAFTLSLLKIVASLEVRNSTVFTAYIESSADYPLSITDTGTLKYIGSASDVAITSAGLLLNIMMLKDASGNVTSIVQASKLS